MIRLDAKPGVVSAILFVFLDLALIAALDRILEIFVNRYYYRRMRNGNVLRVRSANIPVLTTYLLDKIYLPGNLLALIVKSGVIAIVFLINLNIDSVNVPTFQAVSRRATFGMDPAAYAGDSWPLFTVTRMWKRTQSCFTTKDEVITYYKLAFNLSNGVFLEHDRGVSGVNKSRQYEQEKGSALCLSPEYVLDPISSANVTGCSRVTEDGCHAWIASEREGNLTIAKERPYTNHGVNYTLTYFDQGEVNSTWPEFKNVQLTCVAARLTRKIPRKCLLVSRNGTHTIVEYYWHIRKDGSRRTEIATVLLLRRPGPVFEGDIPISELLCIAVLVRYFGETSFRSDKPDWKLLSARLVSHAQAYTGERESYRVITGDKIVSELSIWAIVVTACLAALTLAVYTSTMVSFHRSPLLQLNCVNGISSMLARKSGLTYNECAVVGLCSEGDKRFRVQVMGNEESNYNNCE